MGWISICMCSTTRLPSLSDQPPICCDMVEKKILLLLCGFASVSAMLYTLRKSKQSLQMKAAASSAPAGTKYCSALLELRRSAHADWASQRLNQDDAISKVVSEVSDQLYIYVCADPTVSTAAVCEYISDVYSKVWDEMLGKSVLHLNCVVVGDVSESGLISRSQIYALPALQAVYTQDGKQARELLRGRRDSGLSEVAVEDTLQLFRVPSPAAYAEKSSGKFFFFDSESGDIPKYRKVALGGTFDQLHNGHRKLLALAAAVCTDSLLVGITGDEMLRSKKNADKIAAYPSRRDGVQAFLGLAKPGLKVNTVELQDPFGPTVTDGSLEAIVVSSETVAGAQKINALRVERGMKEMDVLVSRRTSAAVLSSTFMRDRASSGGDGKGGVLL